MAGLILIYLCLPLAPPEQPLTTQILSADGEVISLLFRENRQPIPLPMIPQFLQEAFLAVEDHRFYQHNGFSPVSFCRAVYHNMFVRKGLQGFSTITQQVAKNGYLTAEKLCSGRSKNCSSPSGWSYITAKMRSRTVPEPNLFWPRRVWGENRGTYLFWLTLSDLNRIEWALLTAYRKAPPSTRLTLTRKVPASGLRLFSSAWWMSATSLPRRRRDSERTAPSTRSETDPKQAHYFLDYVLAETEDILRLSKDQIQSSGLRIETTLSLPLQQAAEEALKSGLSPIQQDLQPQGALIAADPRTGAILALVGGTDYFKTPFNRALKAYRQPGSAFKPFVYLAALEAGYNLSSTVACQVLSLPTDTGMYQPRDYGSKPYHQRDMTLREALAVSCNIVAVSLHYRLGINPTINLARRLGITSPLAENLSLALGTSEVTPFELLQAYLPQAGQGQSTPRWAGQRIYNAQGRLIWERKPRMRQVLDPRLAFLITSVLEDALRPGGTAAGISNRLRRPAAGKTGTTQDNRDAWFIGYTPELLAVVYLGDDHNKPLPAGSGALAARSGLTL